MTDEGPRGTVRRRDPRPDGRGPLRATRHASVIAAATVLILAVGALLAPSATAGDRDRTALLRLVNAAREHHDLDPLALDRDLSGDAKEHTREMIRHERIYDPDDILHILRGRRFHIGAATVGCAPSLNALRRAWMRSDEHREILLHPELEKVGFGVIWPAHDTNPCGEGAVWATGIYYG